MARPSEAASQDGGGEGMNLCRRWIGVSVLAVTATLGCSEPSPETPKVETASAQQAPRPADEKVPPGTAPKIDEKRAMGYVKDLVAFGRRAPGSPGQKK